MCVHSVVSLLDRYFVQERFGKICFVMLGILSEAIDFRLVGSQSQAQHLQIQLGLFSVSPLTVQICRGPLDMPIVQSV